MKLNPDCIRDVLLYLEDNLVINKNKFSIVTLKDLEENLRDNYSQEDIFYSVYNLHQIRFIDGRINDANDMKMFFCDIQNITWNGHQFLNNIRPKTVWDATKSGASKLGIMSIHALSLISSTIIEKVVSDPQVIGNIVSQIKF